MALAGTQGGKPTHHTCSFCAVVIASWLGLSSKRSPHDSMPLAWSCSIKLAHCLSGLVVMNFMLKCLLSITIASCEFHSWICMVLSLILLQIENRPSKCIWCRRTCKLHSYQESNQGPSICDVTVLTSAAPWNLYWFALFFLTTRQSLPLILLSYKINWHIKWHESHLRVVIYRTRYFLICHRHGILLVWLPLHTLSYVAQLPTCTLWFTLPCPFSKNSNHIL